MEVFIWKTFYTISQRLCRYKNHEVRDLKPQNVATSHMFLVDSILALEGIQVYLSTQKNVKMNFFEGMGCRED